MSILRLIILFLLGLFFRRLYLSVKKVLQGGAPPPGGGSGDTPRGPSANRIREEDISDADFEEIP